MLETCLQVTSECHVPLRVLLCLSGGQSKVLFYIYLEGTGKGSDGPVGKLIKTDDKQVPIASGNP